MPRLNSTGVSLISSKTETMFKYMKNVTYMHILFIHSWKYKGDIVLFSCCGTQKLCSYCCVCTSIRFMPVGNAAGDPNSKKTTIITIIRARTHMQSQIPSHTHISAYLTYYIFVISLISHLFIFFGRCRFFFLQSQSRLTGALCP